MKRNGVNLGIQLSEKQKKAAMAEIVSFYQDVRGEEIGMIGQSQILDLFMEHLAPIIYNKALDDINRWYKYQQENMESDFYTLYKEVR